MLRKFKDLLTRWRVDVPGVGVLPPELVELVHEDLRLRVVPLPQLGMNSGAVADVQQGRPNTPRPS